MFKRTVLAVVVCMLLISMLSITTYADDSCSISILPNFTQLEIAKGGREQVALNGIFTDNKGHEMSYSLDESEESLKARIKDGVLLIDPLELGEFEIKITAKCEVSGDEKQITIPVNIVESEDEGNPAQYGYDETPAESVSVYVTISSDGIPLIGNDANNTILAHLKVEVPYFDLGLYGLEKYYRYHTENGRGKYVDEEIVERPTAMHLMIYMTERYYMGLPEESCCKGTSGIMNYNDTTAMRNMYGETAYIGSLKAYYLTGAATSSYMANLWGHDENLMYYRNHFFPLMSPGWGSTSDYQLLSEGNTFDLAMYTNWDFFQGGGFCCFDQDEYEAGTGEMLLFSTMKASSSEFGSGELVPISGLKAEIYDEEWNQVATVDSSTAGFGYAFQDPGTYYILGLDQKAGTYDANKSPASAIVRVRDSFEDYAFSKIANQDGILLPKIESLDDIPGVEHFDVSVPAGTTEVKVTWPDLPEDASLWVWDYETGQPVQMRSTASIGGNVITFDPAAWKKDNRAALIRDVQGNLLGAFTFCFYTPEEINFPPSLKNGVKAVNKISFREKKDYHVNLSQIFIDYDGDEMTYTVSVDGAGAVSTDEDFLYRDEQPGQHTLLFTPTDSKGAEGETYTVDLRLTADQAPELKDPSAAEKTVDIRYNEEAKLNLLDVFRDFDEDHIVYMISKDNEAAQEIDPEEITEYGAWISATTRESWQARNFRYKPEGIEDIGTHVFKIKAKDDLKEGTDVFTYTVNVVDDQAPVPAEAEYVDYCMKNHYWIWDYRNCFTDPENDNMTYTYSVNHGPSIPCDNYRTGDLWNVERLLIDGEEPVTVTFYATDPYGKTGSFEVKVYPTPEVLHEINVGDNSFDASEDGKTVYDVQNGFPATWILGFDISNNVTLRSVKYSEENGHFNYYLDVDCFGMDESDVFDIMLRSQPSGEGYYVGPSFGKSYYNENHIAIPAKDGVTEGVLKWNNQRPEFDYLQIHEHWRWYRIFVNASGSSDAKPEELLVEAQKEGLYQGELTDRSIVKARYSDGVVRYLNDAEISPVQFDETGKQTLSAVALGLRGTSEIDVKKVPSYMTILNDKGKYGRMRLARITDKDGEPIEGAEVTIGEPEINSAFSYNTYDDFTDNVKKTYDMQVRLPMTIESDAEIKAEFEMLKDEAYAINLLRGADIDLEEKDGLTIGAVTIRLADGKASTAVDWIDRHDQYTNGRHCYDRFNISVKTGACEIIGKVSSWDEKDNAEFLVYPSDMADVEIRADAMGDRSKTIAASYVTEDAVQSGDRHEQSFKIEGLDAGTYKLAVFKPGKYVVSIADAELDGTADVGTIEMTLFGDVTGDGKLRSGDATQIGRYIVGNRQFTEMQKLAADVTQDGKIRSGDMTHLLRYIVGNKSTMDDIA